MPKEKKTDLEWESDFRAFAVSTSDKMGKGKGAAKGSKEAEIIEKIKNCPIKKGAKKGRGLSGFIVGARSISCTCTYHPCYVPPSRAPAPVRGPPSRNNNNSNKDKGMYNVGWELPKKPDRPLQRDIEGKSEFIYKKGYMDVHAFGPTTGHCYSCKSPNIKAKDRCSHLKFVWNNGWPYYAIGVDIQCQSCNTTIKSIDSKCVETLPKKDRLSIPFIQTGGAHGVAFNIIELMRLGHYAGSIAQAAEALITVKCGKFRAEYESKAMKKVSLEGHSSFHPFQELPRAFIPKSASIIQAYLLDYSIHKNHLLWEIMTPRSKQAFGMDHQAQIMKRVGRRNIPTKEGEDAKQTGIINGDYGLVHNLVVVPDNGEDWMNDALDEVCRRHGDECPEILFVDCNCCSNTLEEASTRIRPKEGDDGVSFWETKLDKKLDGFHSTMRMSRAGNASNPRHQMAARQCSKAIYIKDQECLTALENARLEHALTNLTDADKTADWKRYGRNTPGPGAMVAQRLIAVLRHHRRLDAEIRERYRAQGFDVEEIDQDSSHPAYPVVTKAFASAVTQQAIHSLNGCMDCNGRLAHARVSWHNYRNTTTRLPMHSSPFGTSRCETFHSVAARHFYSLTGIRPSYYDARSLWKAIHFNRNKLRKLNQDVPPNGVAPNEYHNTRLVYANGSNSDPPILWGFDYCRSVVAKRNQETYEDALKALNLGEEDPEIDVVELETEEKPDDDDNEAAVVTDAEDNDFTRGWDNEEPTDYDLNPAQAQSLITEELQTLNSNPSGRRRNRSGSRHRTPPRTPHAPSTYQRPTVETAITVQASETNRVTPPAINASGISARNDSDLPDETENEPATNTEPATNNSPPTRTPGRRSLSHLDSEQPIPNEEELMNVIQNRLTTDDRVRDTGRRRALRGDTNLVNPTFNEEMETVWQDLYSEAIVHRSPFNSGSIDKVFIQHILQKCVHLEITERAKGPAGKKLLPVGIQQCTAWVKEITRGRNDNIRLHRWSEESAQATDIIEDYLQNTSTQANPIIDHDNLQTIGTDARPIPDNTNNEGPEIKKAKRAKLHCRLCGAEFGSGEGQHKKYECPSQPKLTKEQKAVKKQERQAAKSAQEKAMARRVLVAQANITLDTEAFRQLSKDRPNRRNPKERGCVVCGFVIHKVKQDHPDWHFVKSNKVLYCPWADPKSIKDDIIRRQNEKREQRNRKRRVSN